MTKSLFDQTTADEFIARINQLKPISRAEWGKMNVAQMLAHCQTPIRMANGSLVTKPNKIIRFLFGKSAKKQLLNDPVFKKNLPTFSEARIANERDFHKEKELLVELIHNFQKKGPEGVTKDPHVFFGEMSIRDWDILQVKHLDHHLTQFGV